MIIVWESKYKHPIATTAYELLAVVNHSFTTTLASPHATPGGGTLDKTYIGVVVGLGINGIETSIYL